VLLIKIIILVVLAVVAVQDILSRSVYWIVFPLLATLFVVLRLLSHQSLSAIWQPTIINSGFLMLQLLLVSAWFSLKQGVWINITTKLLSWGDILFLLCTAFYLSVTSFLFFYMTSLISVLIIWFVWQLISSKKDKQIPLAGFQALLLMLFLAGDWWVLQLHITNDDWLLNLILK
jgi:hypothetical protein